ncbi:hypothetical protein C5613_39310 [Rhodococcus opacus]|uniref:Uncharacterized protein n=1 Tax=Rhodococcus opacus TaxID=37919 RepID=A0A2S8IJV8_RHOOP|nr:hypothetical protein C5613_39310 [Rhodococcus opacus]
MTFRSAVAVVGHIGDDDTTALPVARQATTSHHLTCSITRLTDGVASVVITASQNSSGEDVDAECAGDCPGSC